MMSGKSSFRLCFSLGTFFLLLLNHVSGENKTEPRKNANLSPFESWRSAYFCMNYTPIPSSCWGKQGYIIKLDGVLDVSASDISDFCNNGCKSHTLDVLNCIEDVKRDFYFGTKQNVSFVRDAINNACAATQRYALNTNVTKYPNSATSLYGRFYMPLASTLTTMAFIATFGV